MTIQQSFNNFILSRKLAGLSPKTIDAYRQFVRPFVDWYGASKSLENLSQEHITQYLDRLLERPVSQATKSTHIRHLKTYLKWCTEEYTVNYNYHKIKVPKSPKKRVTIYRPDQVQLILNSVKAESDWLVLRNQAILCAMYDSGLRQSEVVNLELVRIDFEDKTMVVHGKGNKERTVPLGETTARLFKAYISKCPYESKYMFVGRRGKPITANAIKIMVHKVAQVIPFDLSSHKLRHNFATNTCIDQFEQKGQMDVYGLKAIMGHEDVKTTEQYLHHASEVIASRNHISHLDLITSRT